MPTYEYECQRCGHRFELFQSMTEEPRKRCPECRGKVQRLPGRGAGFIFKGPGFYATDYRKSEPAAATEPKTPAESRTPSASETGTKGAGDSKSDTKKDD